jgi:alkaline phosphatase D
MTPRRQAARLMTISRRRFIQLAAGFGAALAFRSPRAHASVSDWKERRDLYPQGVASGDPHADSVILWARRPPVENNGARTLVCEVAEDPNFNRVAATATANISVKTDWTGRVLAAGLRPRTVYWYRFTDEQGFGSRIGRTITAPSVNDPRPVSFAFVSCQMVPAGACNAYRRMIWEDEQKAVSNQLGFVLHLGDFVYEVVWYPEDRAHYYSRKLRDVVRYPQGEKIRDFHVPVTVEDYRALYRGYLSDADLQDARARWPFVCMWDNHEFSWKGWQTQQDFDGVRPAQTRKVAANQAWFEYQPARVLKPNPDINVFDAPRVQDVPLKQFDDHGLGLEAGNRAAINSLKLYRALRYGRNVELILTDNRSFRSEPVMQRKEAAVFQPQNFPYVYSENAVDVLDAGRTYDNGKPPDTIRFNDVDVPNFRKREPPQSMLGREQKSWFLRTLRQSAATWKLWGNSVGMLDLRLDFQNLPKELAAKWPDDGYGTLVIDDWSAYRHERAQVLDHIRKNGITGVAAICGDRHAFEAGLVSATLRPNSFDPIMPEFITASISAPGLFESAEYSLSKDHPLRAVYLYEPANSAAVQPAINFSMMHGVRAGLALQRTGDLKQALAESNSQLAPHLSFIDVGAHGYSVVRADQDQLEVEFVCLPRPLERSAGADGGPLGYRVAYRVKRWQMNTQPKLERTKVEGMLPLVV